MLEIQVEAQRNVERRRRQRSASSGSMGAAMRSASFLAGGAAGRELARSCHGLPASGLGFEPQSRIDDEVLQEINAECWRRGIVPELKL